MSVELDYCAICHQDFHWYTPFIFDKHGTTKHPNGKMHRSCLHDYLITRIEQNQNLMCPVCRGDIVLSKRERVYHILRYLPEAMKYFVSSTTDAGKFAFAGFVGGKIFELMEKREVSLDPRQITREALAAVTVAMITATLITIPITSLKVAKQCGAVDTTVKEIVYSLSHVLPITVNYFLHRKAVAYFGVSPRAYTASALGFIVCGIRGLFVYSKMM